MSQAIALPFTAVEAAEIARDLPSLPLAGISVGKTAIITELILEAEVAAWLRAVGIREGEQVTVLRRAAFGGPIHLRTSSGGEFALHQSLAASVMTRVEPPP
jgi:ferrous iron transport protein A